MYFIEKGNSRTQNNPLHQEVAAIFCSEDGAPPKREFVVKCRDGNRFQFLLDTNPNVDPLSYPLLFPQGGERVPIGYTT